jgi:hypothetical protein
MLDVHPPHHAANTWRDFFIHIATIVVGLIIAVGLEQTVEHIHHHSQANEIEESLHRESIANRALVQRDFATIDEAHRLIRLNMASIMAATGAHGKATFHLSPYMQYTYVIPPTDTAWLALRDDNLLEIVPPSIAKGYSKLEAMRSVVVAANNNVMQSRQVVQALLHLRDDAAQLSPEEFERLLLAFSQLDQALTEMRNGLTIFSLANELALKGGTLSSAEEEPIFMQLPQQ